MGRARIRAAARGDRRQGGGGSGGPGGPARRPAGLAVVERDGSWHLHGTVQAGGRSRRVRRSTQLPARPEFRADAEALRERVEREILDELVHGRRPSPPLAVAARHYLGVDAGGRPKPGSRAERIGPSDLRVLEEIAGWAGARPVDAIEAREWNAFLDRRHKGNAADTRSRYVNPILSFLGWCADPDRGWLPAVPAIKRRPDVDDGIDITRRAPRRPVEDMRPELLVFLFDQAHLALKAQLYVAWGTGARVSSILFGCRLEDLVLGRDRQQLTFRDTKNSDDVVALLQPPVVAVLQAYLAHRGKLHLRSGPLFLTPRGEPYSDRGRRLGWGGANKTAFNAMKRRAILKLLRWSVQARRAGDLEAAIGHKADARLVRQITQHWLRHWLATHSMAAEVPERLIMAQAGWRDPRSVRRYQHDVAAVRARLMDRLPIGGPSLEATPAAAPDGEEKKA